MGWDASAWRAMALAVGVGLWGAPALAGGFYRHVDADGVVHFTDAPSERGFQRFELPPAAKVRVNYYPSGQLPGAVAKAAVRSPRGKRASQYDALIAELASHYGVSAALVKAVIAAESGFDPNAVSHKGAQGLMQLMPDTATLMGVDDPFEPRDNMKGGIRYLRHLLDRFGNTVHAVAAYNAGPENVARHEGVPPYPETEAYVRNVMAYYHRYHGEPAP